MYAVLASGEVVGHSIWPWDDVYRPVVGCFFVGALVATGPCDLEPKQAVEPPSTAPAARIGRRLARAVGRTSPPSPPFEGPAGAAWFRMGVPPEVAARLRADDPVVRLARLEDGERLVRQGAPPPQPTAAATVETLLDRPQGPVPETQDGFAAFLAAPPLHQLEMVFLEYLRRLPEREARRAYLPRLEAGEITALDLRAILLASDEFKARRIGHGSRLGASLTSGAWTRLAAQPALTDRG